MQLCQWLPLRSIPPEVRELLYVRGVAMEVPIEVLRKLMKATEDSGSHYQPTLFMAGQAIVQSPSQHTSNTQ